VGARPISANTLNVLNVKAPMLFMETPPHGNYVLDFGNKPRAKQVIMPALTCHIHTSE